MGAVAQQLVFIVLMALAILRVTRLLVVDEFPPVKAIRDWFVGFFATVDRDGNVIPDREKWGRLAGLAYPVAYVWTCPWCMSFWAGLALWGIADWRLSVPWPWLIIALGSQLAGIFAMIESEHEQRWKIRDRDIAEFEARRPR